MDTVGVYVQVPFCQTKCTYCNFHTGIVPQKRYEPYVAAAQTEITGASKQHHADTLYIGGGTPSLLKPELLANLIASIRDAFSWRGGEVTLEADPETVEAGKARAWATRGINRISFGSQSFVDEELRAAGRMHRASDIYRAVPILREAGIRNVSFDLIAGLPKQTRESWRFSLAETIRLEPEHVSIYMMEIDEGSRLGLEVLNSGTRYSARELPSDEEMAEFYREAQQQLCTAGYEQYEISNWAKPRYASKHNLKYWRRQPYLGFGAGAHSFSGKQRWSNVHDAAAYVAALEAGRSPVEKVEEVTAESAFQEEIFLGLRQLAGIDVGRIEREYGVDLQEKLRRLASNGMLEREGDVVRLAPGKLHVSNEVLVELLR